MNVSRLTGTYWVKYAVFRSCGENSWRRDFPPTQKFIVHLLQWVLEDVKSFSFHNKDLKNDIDYSIVVFQKSWQTSECDFFI